jgi:GNAT superfamily N-acetyltransferase
MNMSVEIRKVTTKQDLKVFLYLTKVIYKDDPYFVPPIYSDKLKFIDPKKGTFFDFGQAEYFLAYKNDKPVGRIAALTDSMYEKYHDKNTGFFGFFESINDQKVADALYETAANWLKEKNKTIMRGPMSFTLYDESSFLYKGFDSLPVIMLPYNHEYYNDQAVNCGFKKSIDWYAFMVSIHVKIKPVFFKIRDRVIKQKGIKIQQLNMKHFDEAVQDVGIIFKDAWAENWGHVPFADSQLLHLASELKQAIIPELTYLAYDNGKCVGFMMNVWDANPALKKANGKLFPFGIIKILLEMKKIKRVRTVAMGVLKEYRHRGIDVAFYINAYEQGLKLGIQEAECSVIVETNQRMIGALEDLDAKRYKTYRFYEKKI